MNSPFTLNGTHNGVSYTTVRDNGRYNVVFAGQGLEGSFHFSDDDAETGANPLEVLRSKLFANDLPDQSNVSVEHVFKTSTYFV